MTNELSKYSLDKLAQRVEDGSDSDGQKAQPILIAKAMLELQISIKDLQKQISLASVGIKGTVNNASKNLS